MGGVREPKKWRPRLEYGDAGLCCVFERSLPLLTVTVYSRRRLPSTGKIGMGGVAGASCFAGEGWGFR